MGQNTFLEYPRSIFLIIATEFCERFSFCGLRTILSLYLRNILLFHENSSTVIYHVFIMLCYLVPAVGAALADSKIGRFRTILYFSLLYAVGNVLTCFAAIPPFALPQVSTTMIGLTLIAVGSGGIKPCVAVFGGEQFTVPAQEAHLQQFFSIFYFAINFGGLAGMIATPILRKSFCCYGDDSCYALGFGFPAALMIIALVLFVAGKPLYRIKEPKENTTLNVFRCAKHAAVNKFRMRKAGMKEAHWLDYARDEFSPKLIQDMKVVLGVMYIFIPLPIFWSLFDQQGSRWTFQASRMSGEIAGVRVYPDQMQVVNPAIVMLLIPLFDKALYPWLERRFRTTALQKMVVGGFMAGLAFVASGLLELSLESTYPVLPSSGEAHVNLINTLPCGLHVVSPFHRIHTINSSMNHVFRNVTAGGATGYKMTVFVPDTCGDLRFEWPSLELDCVATDSQIDSVILGAKDSKLKAYIAGPEDLCKSLSGKPKIRVMYLQSVSPYHKAKITLQSSGGLTDAYYAPEQELGVSDYMVLEPGRYSYSVSACSHVMFEAEVVLRIGGVYSLLLVDTGEHIAFSKTYTMTSPNVRHMLWLLPQYVLISIAEVMFGIAGLQFSYTQAPKSLKTVTLAAWYISVALGNVVVILITQARFLKTQANEFFLFALLILVDMAVFLRMSNSYQYAPLEHDDSATSVLGEARPLLTSQ